MALASKVRIEVDGDVIMDFIDLTIDQRMDGIQEFNVTCRMETFEDPDGFVMDNSKKYMGSIITIAIDALKPGDNESTDLFFKGIVNSIKAEKSGLSDEDVIRLSGYSPDILLHDHAGCRSFENKTLKQIVEEVLKPYPKDVLKTKVNPIYREQIPYCVQYRENSFEFLRRLAARYGEWMFYDGSELAFGKPKSKEEELVLANELYTFDFSLNLKAPGFKYVAYDYLNAKYIDAATDTNTGKDQLNEFGKHAFKQSGNQFTESPVLDYAHLNVNANSYAKRLKENVELEASAIALGMSEMKATGEHMNLVPGTKIKIKAPKTESSGEVDYGEYLITDIKHKCDYLMNYENEFTALPAEATIPANTNPEAFPKSEPQSAKVMDNDDPEKLGRVRVQFMWQESSVMSPWVRIVMPYSGDDMGFYFIPEIDDEVLVGFEACDAERPFVMGSLYHGKHKPEGGYPDSDNSFKGIVTRSKLRIEFDEKKKQTTIETPAGNKAVLSDDGKSIVLHDQNQNKVELTTSGISMESMKDIKISSKSKVTIEGLSGVDISSTADAKLSGLNVNLEADVGITAKGNATAEISSVGNTTVKGTMVMIN